MTKNDSAGSGEHATSAAQMQIATIGVWCGLAAFVTWFGMGVESVLRPFQDNRRENFWPLPFALTIATFVCVHLCQRGRSRTERIGFAVILIASVIVLTVNIGLQLDLQRVEELGAMPGIVIWLMGLVCFGLGTLLARSLPWYGGWAIILLEPMSVAAAYTLSPIAPMLPRGAYSGNVGKGIALAIVALALHRVRVRSARTAGTPA